MSNELTIQSLLLILKRRRSIILWTLSICVLLGATASVYFFIKPRYRASGEIEIQKTATDGLGLENLTSPSQSTSDPLDATITLQTEATILQSSSLALKVVEDLNLENTEDFHPMFNPLGWALDILTPGAADEPMSVPLEKAPHRREHALKIFERHLKIKPQSGTRLIDIQYTSTDPKISAAVINDVAKSLVDFTLNSRYTATNQVSTWLTGQLGDIKKEAEAQQAKVENLQRESGIYSFGTSDAQGKEMAYSSTLDQLQQATQSLSAATSNRILKGALYKSVENGDPELISGLAGSSLAGASPAVNNSFLLLQNLRGQQAALASQLASDTSKYGSANPKLGDEQASLNAINAEIKSEVERIGKRAQNDYQAAQLVESNLQHVYDQQRKAADGLNDKAIALLIARQEATDARTLYQTLYSHLKEAGVIEGLRSSNISVVDPGLVPSKPYPYGLIALALSVFVGGFFGVCGALIVESTDNRIEGLATIENMLRAPVLAVLPMTQEGGSKLFKSTTSKSRKVLANGNQANESARLAVLDGPNTAYVEALRALRESLIFPRHGVPPKTILVTSAAEKEGKSTLSLNLAAALVLNGSRVLLIDADLRSAGLSGYMGYARKMGGLIEHGPQGLSEALADSSEPRLSTPYPELSKLSALTAGSVPNYPAELLGSPRMKGLISQWKKDFDYIVIDSPPVLAVADALILARLADTTLLVTRHGQSTQKSLERAYHTLSDSEGRSVGVVVNGVHRNSVSFNEFYGYQGTIYYSEV